MNRRQINAYVFAVLTIVAGGIVNAKLDKAAGAALLVLGGAIGGLATKRPEGMRGKGSPE